MFSCQSPSNIQFHDIDDKNGRRFSTQQYRDKLRAVDFVCEYVPSFCVYCSLTHQLYASYDLYNLEQASGVIVLPKTEHDTFTFSDNDAVLKTTFIMVTNPKLKMPRLIDIRTNDAKCAQNSLLNLAQKKHLLPVVMKSDLRRIRNTDMPYLSMHTIDLSKLHSISHFRSSQIQSTILNKLDSSFPQ